MSASSETPRSELLLFGGTGEIGRAIGEEVLRRGFDLVFTFAKNAAQAELLTQGWRERFPAQRVSYFRMDYATDSQHTEWKTLANPAGAIFASGVFAQAPIPLIEPEDLERVFWANVFGPMRCAQALLPEFLKRRRGRFVFLSSIASRGGAGVATYASSKAALNAFSTSLGMEWGRRGVTSVALNLGVVETEAVRKHEGAVASLREWAQRNPLRTYISLTDVAQLAVDACQDSARSLNASVLEVCGGLPCLT